MKERDARAGRGSKGVADGVTAIVFLVIGFQLAVFVMKVVSKPAQEAARVVVDTVYVAVYEPLPQERSSAPPYGGRAASPSVTEEPRRSRLGGCATPERLNRTPAVRRPSRKVESFRFDPNTATLEEFVRLGLSERQAGAVVNFREKGGRFRTKSDFSRMYTVSDTLYDRLEPFIDIPRLELNSADSAALTTLRGIGPWYASKIISYRNSLGGFYSTFQLLEIYGIDSARFENLREAVCADTSLIHPLDINALPEDSLERHPYVSRSLARSIVRLRRIDTLPVTVESLLRERLVDSLLAVKLGHYLFSSARATVESRVR